MKIRTCCSKLFPTMSFKRNRLFVIIPLVMATSYLACEQTQHGVQLTAAEPTNLRIVPAEIGPEKIVLTDGVQPFMFQMSQGTLVAMAYSSLPPGHVLPEINIFPGIPTWIISRDKGKSWKRWTPKGIVSATPYEPPAPSPGFEGNAAQLSDGTVIILEWVATGRRDDGLWTGHRWESKDDCQTLQGPIEMTIDLPNAQKMFDDSGRPFIGINFHRSLLELPNGDLLTTVYGAFKEDTTPVAYQPTMMKMRCVLLRSSDKGRSWKYASTIAVDPKVGHEGFDEPVMIRLSKGPKAGRLVCLMRTGRDTHLYQAHSDDDGTTWSVPRELDFFGVDPDLVEMTDGTLVGGFVWLNEGDNRRPGSPTQLIVSRDQGDTWSEAIRMPVGENPGYGRWSSYASLTEIEPGRLLAIFDVIPDSWKGTVRYIGSREIQVPSQ